MEDVLLQELTQAYNKVNLEANLWLPGLLLDADQERVLHQTSHFKTDIFRGDALVR